MSRVITFSTKFPKGHIRAGEPTYFMEYILSGVKKHTIRAGNRWKEGDTFSPRVWSGRPYASKQVHFSPDLLVCKTYPFSMHPTDNVLGVHIRVNGDFMLSMPFIERVAANDALTLQDFISWMKLNKMPFHGQIICWDESVKY